MENDTTLKGRELLETGFEIKEIVPVYVVWQNTDLTEGRGGLRVLAVCESRETAYRLGAGEDVQGTDCTVTPDVAFRVTRGTKNFHHTRVLVPGLIQPESKEDAVKRAEREEKEALWNKARAVLTEDEIKKLSR